MRSSGRTGQRRSSIDIRESLRTTGIGVRRGVAGTPFALQGTSVETRDPAIDSIDWFHAAISELDEKIPDARDELVLRLMSIDPTHP